MKRLLLLALLVPSLAHAAPSGINWRNGQRLTDTMLQNFDSLKANQQDLDLVSGQMSGKANARNGYMTNLFLQGVQSYDGTQDPNTGIPGKILPSLSMPCHAIGQSYVISSGCFGAVATDSREGYAWNFGFTNSDDGTIPSGTTTNTSAPDKVSMYISADQRSIYSPLWGMNLVLAIHPDSWNGIGVLSIAVTSGGSGYTSAPQVIISAPNGASSAPIQATATATVLNGVVTSVTITQKGKGYDEANPPTVTFVGGGATTQASGTPTVGPIARFKGVSGFEMDMGNGHECDVSAFGNGDGSCPANRGLWLTGGSTTNRTTGPAAYITSIGNVPLWDMGIYLDGNSVRDSAFVDYTNSKQSIRIGGSHADGLNLSTGKFSEAAIKLASGTAFGDNAKYQGILFSPPNGTGATDWIIDQGPGLDISSSQRLNFTAPYTYINGTTTAYVQGQKSYFLGKDPIHVGGVGIDVDATGNITQKLNDWSWETYSDGVYRFSITDNLNTKTDLLTIQSGSISVPSSTKLCLDKSCNRYIVEYSSSSKITIGNSSNGDVMSIDDNGNIITKGTITQNGSL